MDRACTVSVGCLVLRAFLLVSLAVTATPLAAQRPPGGSVRVATDHWSNGYVARLRDRGYLTGLNPLVQPWRAADIARQLARLDPDTLPEPVRDWVRLLRSEFGWRTRDTVPSVVRGGGSVAGGARASTSRRLDPLRPLGDARAWPWFRVGGWIEAGPVAAEARLYGDMYFNDDPDGVDPLQRGPRSDFAYVAADFPVASMEVGRLARNWSLYGTPGLMVSDVATPYPQLGVEVRVWRLALRAFTGELDSLDGRKRYLAAHRLDYETENLVLSFGESILYSLSSGGLSLRFLNPVEFFFFDAGNAPNDDQHNLMLTGQVWWRLRPAVLTGEFLLDDIDVAPDGVAEPMVYALAATAEMPAVLPWLGLGARYQRVSAWSYRAYTSPDRYSYLERGLGDNYSDFDRLTVSGDLFPPLPGLRLTPILQFQRQGEGDFRDPMPGGAYAGEPGIFLGVVEKTARLGLRGRYQPVRFAWLGWDAGYNWIRNRDHVQDVDENLFSAAAEVGVQLPLPPKAGS